MNTLPPPILPSPLFSTSVQPPLPCHLQPSPTQLFLWLNGWLNDHIWCAILLNDRYYGSAHVETWYLSARRTWCVFCSTRRQVYWGLTHVIFCWYSDLILHTNKQTKQTNTHTHTHTHTHTQKDTQHTQGPADLHTHINIYLHHLLSAHNSYLYYLE